jgi:hypothetical protein
MKFLIETLNCLKFLSIEKYNYVFHCAIFTNERGRKKPALCNDVHFVSSGMLQTCCGK